jgi:hypothetical protein
MCTVTVVPHDGGFRLACNRDERRTRVAALPPRVQRAGARLAAFPVDPLGGGTWVGVNDAGVVLALLNGTPATSSDAPPIARARSRGFIVRTMLRHDSAESILDTLPRLDPGEFDAYRLVIIDSTRVTMIASDGSRLTTAQTAFTHPMLFTSSSLGDALVEPPRRDLFERMVIGAPRGLLDAQARFHRHRWPERPHISVCMERPDAITVSRTVVDVTARGRHLVYEPLASAAAWQRKRTSCFLR